MKKVLLFMLALVMLFAFVACGGEPIEEDNTAVDVEVNEEKTEEQVRIDENNAAILPKLDEVEAVIVEIEAVVADNDLREKYQSVIDKLREELDGVTENHYKIIDMGGYLKGTADFEAAVDGAIEKDKEILDLIVADIEPTVIQNELIDKLNELVDLVNEVTVNAQDNGWDKNEDLLSEMSAVYVFIDEVKGKIYSSDDIEETYKNENIAKINELLPVYQEYLGMVSKPCTE